MPLKVMPGGGHSANVWRAALGPMLGWMTPHLVGEAAQADATAARTAAKAAVARTAAARKAHHGEPRRPHAAMASKKP
ncbi:MAG TPA: hypothetical protein VGJ50_24355 [Streptosporangiaceae bacterium]